MVDFLLPILQITLVALIVFGLLAAMAWGGVRVLGAAGKEMVASLRDIVRELGQVSASTAADVAERVSASVAAGVAEAVRGPVYVDDGESLSPEQLDLTVPWDGWGEGGESGENPGDPRYSPDPTDEWVPDPTPLDNRTRAVSVPVGWDPIGEAQRSNGPRVGDLSGEHFDLGSEGRN